jgi:phytoene dehydrogenase-like protein
MTQPSWDLDRMGLAAAITLAEAGCKVLVLEANSEIGGGMRSAELTVPGYVHDICSSISPFAAASPFFRLIPFERYALDWIQPKVPLAHPLEGGRAAVLHRSLEATSEGLREDGHSYRRLMEPFVQRWEDLVDEILRPLLHAPRHPLLLARFARHAMRSGSGLARGLFQGDAGQALVAGLAAHSFLPLEQVPSAAVALVLAVMGHAVGWPMPFGGAQRIADAMASHLRALGGRIVTDQRVTNIDDLPRCRAVLLDLTPRQFLRIAEHRMPARYAEALRRFRYGSAAFKIDYALAAPIPWRAAECRCAGTVHLGGTLEEIERAERKVASGEHPEHPFVLLAQHSLFDFTRAPSGRHTAWAYCHVPHGSTADMTVPIEAQIERFAPGFRKRILARNVLTPAQLEEKNGNLVGGDINGGLANLRQLVARPVLNLNPYRTPLEKVYICSASTPPGGGVHGMAGYHAARSALKREFGHRDDVSLATRLRQGGKSESVGLGARNTIDD